MFILHFQADKMWQETHTLTTTETIFYCDTVLRRELLITLNLSLSVHANYYCGLLRNKRFSVAEKSVL